MEASILSPTHYQEIVSRIENLNPTAQRKWGKMSVEQMLVHVADQVRVALGYKICEDVSDMMSRNVLKWLALHVTKLPKNVPTVKEVDSEKEATLPTNWAQDKQALLDLLAEFRQKAETETFFPHPKFGGLTKTEWGKLIYSHLVHHLGQFGA